MICRLCPRGSSGCRCEPNAARIVDNRYGRTICLLRCHHFFAKIVFVAGHTQAALRDFLVKQLKSRVELEIAQAAEVAVTLRHGGREELRRTSECTSLAVEGRPSSG